MSLDVRLKRVDRIYREGVRGRARGWEVRRPAALPRPATFCRAPCRTRKEARLRF